MKKQPVSESESESESSRWDDLTDDIFFEILGRLPAKSLHRSKCVSKRWLSSISAPSFARSYILRHLSLSDDATTKTLTFKIDCFGRSFVGRVYALPLPLPHNDFENLLPVTFDFIPALSPDNNVLHYGRTEIVLSNMTFLAASGGLVLLQGVFQDRTDRVGYDQKRIYYYCYICNPVTKEWLELPLISTNDLVGFTCYYRRQHEDTRIWAHTTSFDHTVRHIAEYDPNKIEFTVVSINKDEYDDGFVIHVFSSADETPGWRIFRVPFPPGYKWIELLRKPKAVFSNGKFYWFGDRCVAEYDPFNKPLECEIIPFPPTESSEMKLPNFLFLEACDGRLRLGYLVIRDRGVVWELVDSVNKVWVKKFDFNVNLYSDNGLGFHSFVADTAGDKAYMTCGDSTICILDMKNGSHQEIYKYPFKLDKGGFLIFPESFISSPWPTPVPLRQWKEKKLDNDDHKIR